MRATRFNGKMMRITHGDKCVFLQRDFPGYSAIRTVPIAGGLRDDCVVFGDLNDPRNLEDFFNWVAEKLET